MLKNGYLLLLLFLATGPEVHGFYGPRKTSGGIPGTSLYGLAVSARSIALANSGIGGGAPTAAAAYRNPAALRPDAPAEAEALYTEILGGGALSSLFVSSDIGNDYRINMGLRYMSSGEAVKTTVWGEETGTFNEKSRLILLGGSRCLRQNINIGISMKFFGSTIDVYSAGAVGLDAGILLTMTETISAGFSIINLVSTGLTYNEKKELHCPQLNLGLSHKGKESFPATIMADISIIPAAGGTTASFSTGIESKLFRFLDIRGGIDNKSLTGGIGIGRNNLHFSYAFRYSYLGIHHAAGFEYWFNAFKYEGKDDPDFSGYRLSKVDVKEKAAGEAKVETDKTVMELHKKIGILEQLIAKMTADQTLPESVRDELNKRNGKINTEEEANYFLKLIEDDMKKNKFDSEKMQQFYKDGNYSSAVAEAMKAREADTDYMTAQIFMKLSNARIAAQEGDYEEARNSIGQALLYDETNEEALRLLKSIERLREIGR